MFGIERWFILNIETERYEARTSSPQECWLASFRPVIPLAPDRRPHPSGLKPALRRADFQFAGTQASDVAWGIRSRLESVVASAGQSAVLRR